MRSLRPAIALACGLLILTTVYASARRAPNRADLRAQNPTGTPTSLDVRADDQRLFASAAQGTTWLATYTFDAGPSCVDEGWSSVDITAQLGEYWHVDDFQAMGANFHGRIGVLSGSQSLWCGTRPSSENPYCGYASLPGYGNNWDQAFCTLECVDTGPGAVIRFEADWDSEPGYDATTLEMSNCTGAVSDDNWVVLAGGLNDWDGDLDDFSMFGDTVITVAIADSLHGASGENPLSIRIRFTADGAWSDEDGLWDTDGAFVLDSLSLTGLPTETFEAEALGAKATLSGNWGACTPTAYGDFAALYHGGGLLQDDPCSSNLSCMWAFISGSTYNYACGGHPEQLAVPYEDVHGNYITNEVWSPEIPITGAGVRFELMFDVYRDLPLDPLIFFVWHFRSIDASGCAGGWYDRNFVYFGPNKDWLRSVFPVGDFVEPGAVSAQLAVGVVDMCPFWCGVFGTGNCHSHAPLFDNVSLYRIESQGPQWSARDIDLFQDTFAADGTTTGTARIDMALDIVQSGSPTIRPGDSTVVRVDDPDQGLGLDGSGWAAVYAYVRVDGPTGAAVDATPGALTQNTFRWPYTSSVVDGDGETWHIIRMDTSFTDGDARTGPGPDAFCVDINDNLFVPGDTIHFVFAATSAGPASATSYWTPATGTTTDQAAALANPAECTILPAAGWARGGHILYVDGMNARGAQPYFDSTFKQMGIYDLVDRYDIRGPSSNVGNRPGGRIVDPFQQLLPCYQYIIWNTGDLSNGLIGDGSGGYQWGGGEKADDALMLLTFLENLGVPGGIYFNGDNIANEWPSLSGSAIPLRDTYIQHTLVSDDHVQQAFPVSPRVIGEDNGCFDHITGPDTMVAFGGCPLINDFDVLAPTSLSSQEMRYDGGVPGSNGAVIGQYTLNPDSVTVGVLLSGFSFHSIRDDRAQGELDRSHHMHDILVWLGEVVNYPTPATPSYTTSLEQNYPNPFNPETTIEFTVRERAPVSVRIYNVRGQLVKTLVDDRFAPGVSHRVTWDGRNDAGQAVASGVYFYRMVTSDFTRTRKMVLLK